jgi:hypothetical protein
VSGVPLGSAIEFIFPLSNPGAFCSCSCPSCVSEEIRFCLYVWFVLRVCSVREPGQFSRSEILLSFSFRFGLRRPVSICQPSFSPPACSLGFCRRFASVRGSTAQDFLFREKRLRLRPVWIFSSVRKGFDFLVSHIGFLV